MLSSTYLLVRTSPAVSKETGRKALIKIEMALEDQPNGEAICFVRIAQFSRAPIKSIGVDRYQAMKLALQTAEAALDNLEKRFDFERMG